MFEGSRGGRTVASWIDLAVEGGGAHLGVLEAKWGLSDHSHHSVIGGVVQVGYLVGVVDTREAVDWDVVALAVADEDEGWYEDLTGDTAYDRL